MSNQFKYLQLQKLSQHVARILVCERPSDGWIRATRKAIGMSIRQLAARMGVSQQAVSHLESNELSGAATLKTLRKAAEGMGCEFVYAIVPKNGSLEDLVRAQAQKKAKEIVGPVDHTMHLEAQSVGNLQAKIKELAEELAKMPNSKLWD